MAAEPVFDTDPVSAGLGFAAPAGMHAAIDRVREAGPARKLVPVRVEGRGIPRPGTEVYVVDAKVGVVTSGTMSPILRTGIALAWIDAPYAALDTELELDIRGTRAAARVVQRPFVRGSL
jgi:aminomethyltransferase